MWKLKLYRLCEASLQLQPQTDSFLQTTQEFVECIQNYVNFTLR